ncbi:MAG: SpoIIE family protein phosphatase [Ignavibacteriaceae bacterium]|jgi:serine phosphatase RsbU (regulator of sigma subunit)
MKKLNVLIQTLLFSICILSISLAQQRYKSETNADLVKYTIKDGLPITNIASVSQTADGYVWISGLEGTVRFNGYEFQEPGKEFGLPDMQFNYYDSTTNTIYFASPDKFLILKDNKFQSFTKHDGYQTSGLPGRSVSFIKKDSKGRVWVGTTTLYIDSKNNGSLTLFENGKFTLFDSSAFPLHNCTDMFETPYEDLIFLSDGKNTSTQTEAYIALYKNDKFERIDESKGVKYYGTKYSYEKVSPVTDDKGNMWIPFIGSGIYSKLDSGTSGVLMYDGKDFHTYPGIEKYLVGNNRVTSVLYLEKDNSVYATIADLNGTVYSKNSSLLFKLVNKKWKKIDLYKDTGPITDLSTKDIIPDYKFSFAKLIPGNNISPDLLAVGVLEETISAEHNDQYFYFDGKWKKYDGFKGFPLSVINNAEVILNPLGFSFYFPNKSIFLKESDGLSGIKIQYPYMFSDKNGIVWIYFSWIENPPDVLFGNDGINVWDGNKLHKITTNEGLSSNTVLRVFEDSKGRIWLTTDKGLDLAKAISTRKDQWVIKINPIQKNDGKIYNSSYVLETKSGDIFTWQNYVRPAYGNIPQADFFLGKLVDDKIVEIPNPLPDNLKKIKYQEHNLYELPNGNLLLVSGYSDSINDLESAESNLLIYDHQKWSEPPSSWNVPEEILSYVGTVKNKMYFLSPGHFYSFDGNKFIDLSDSVNSKADFRILKEANIAGTTTNIQAGNYLYIRLRLKGLAIFDGTKLDFYTTKNGLPTANIYNPVTDLKGNVYFIHNLGGLIINGERFNRYYNDNFSLTGQSAITQDRNGSILTWYNNLGIYVDRESKSQGSIKLSFIKVNSSQYYYNKPSSFSYSENSFVFNYSTLNYKDPKSAIYQHKLEGYDLDWSKSSNLQFSEYQNVPPGDYTFKVIAIDNEGSKTNRVTYAFTILPPFWKTWWAYTFYVFLFGGFLYSIREFELKRQKKNAAIKESKLRAEAAELQAKAAEAQSRIIQAENDRKSSELEEARQLQLSMLPKELPQLPHLDIAVYMKTATEVGGDYYDFIVGLDGTLTVAIGDATGHGMKAGTIVSMVKALFSSGGSRLDMKTFFDQSSDALKEIELGRLMMAFMMLKIKSNRLEFTNAGMPPLFIYRKQSKTVEEIMINGMPLGAMKNFPYEIKETEIAAGDTLLLLSDGMPELKNDKDEQFGYTRLKEKFISVAEKESEEIISYLKEEGKHWTNDKEPDDDVTFVVIKIK